MIFREAFKMRLRTQEQPGIASRAVCWHCCRLFLTCTSGQCNDKNWAIITATSLLLFENISISFSTLFTKLVLKETIMIDGALNNNINNLVKAIRDSISLREINGKAPSSNVLLYRDLWILVVISDILLNRIQFQRAENGARARTVHLP